MAKNLQTFCIAGSFGAKRTRRPPTICISAAREDEYFRHGFPRPGGLLHKGPLPVNTIGHESHYAGHRNALLVDIDCSSCGRAEINPRRCETIRPSLGCHQIDAGCGVFTDVNGRTVQFKTETEED